MKRGMVIFALCWVLLTLCACGNQGALPGNDSGQTDNEVSLTDAVEVLVKNFWDTDFMFDESAMFIAQTDEQGNVISVPRANLLFKPDRVIRVVQYYREGNGGEIVVFEEGKDFIVKDGALEAVGSFQQNRNTNQAVFSTSVPYVTDKSLTGENDFPGLTYFESTPSKEAGLRLPFTEGRQIVQMQVSVTYQHSEKWGGVLPSYYGDDVLSRTVQKLLSKEKVELFVYGDSISDGCNSSSMLGIQPRLAVWPELVRRNRAACYGTEVILTNRSVGTWMSSHGVYGGTGWVQGSQITQEGIGRLFESDLKGYRPDIVVIGFGMNDATNQLPIADYVSNIKTMIDEIRKVNPECDIILLGTMLGNPMTQLFGKNQPEYTQALVNIAKLYGNDGVCVVDIGAMHADILEAGKIYTEISANNANHPNDFMARVYAMNIMSALVK